MPFARRASGRPGRQRAGPAVTERTVLVLATLDTKGEEATFLAEAVRRRGVAALLLDLSVFKPPEAIADITRNEVAAAAGARVEDLRALGDRATALAVMARGASVHARRLLDDGRLAGIVAVGGSQGTVAGTSVMRTLQFGLPKLMVSTMASGQTRPYVDTSDIAMLFPVVDLAGLNRFSRQVLDNAAGAIAGMARKARPAAASAGVSVAMTMFGATTPCVTEVASRLRTLGVEPVVFHANGAGGRAMEEWAERGEFAAVLDLTTTELADELAGGHRSAGPDRLEAAGRVGLPQLVAPGALDMVNFGPPESVPAAYAGRKLHRHNSGTTLMRTTTDENARLGAWMAEKLNRARGPTVVAIPLRGFSAYDAVGGAFHDPEADARFVSALKSELRAGIPVVEVDAHINDPEFVDTVVQLYGRLGG
jgi:uncharacterized protein (UPF0261 family)